MDSVCFNLAGQWTTLIPDLNPRGWFSGLIEFLVRLNATLAASGQYGCPLIFFAIAQSRHTITPNLLPAIVTNETSGQSRESHLNDYSLAPRSVPWGSLSNILRHWIRLCCAGHTFNSDKSSLLEGALNKSDPLYNVYVNVKCLKSSCDSECRCEERQKLKSIFREAAYAGFCIFIEYIWPIFWHVCPCHNT